MLIALNCKSEEKTLEFRNRGEKKLQRLNYLIGWITKPTNQKLKKDNIDILGGQVGTKLESETQQSINITGTASQPPPRPINLRLSFDFFLSILRLF